MIDLSNFTNSIRQRLDSDRQRRRLDANYDPAADRTAAGRNHRNLALAQRQIGEIETAFNAPGRAEVRDRTHRLTMEAGTQANRDAFNESLRRSLTARAQRGQLQSSLQANDQGRLTTLLDDNQAELATQADAQRQAGINQDRQMAEQLAATLIEGGATDSAAFQTQLAGVRAGTDAVANQGAYQDLLARIQDRYRSLLSQSLGQGLSAGAGLVGNYYDRQGLERGRRRADDILAQAG